MTVMPSFDIEISKRRADHPLSRRLDLSRRDTRFLGEPDVPISVSKLSRSGILFRTDVPLLIGESFHIIFPDGHTRLGIVRWENADIFACDFDKSVTYRELRKVKIQKPEVTQSDDTWSAESIGPRIRQWRMKRGLTMVELAERLKVSRPTLWKWEKGTVAPRQEAMKVIARALGISEIDLIQENCDETSMPFSQPACKLVSSNSEIEIIKHEIGQKLGIRSEKIRILIEI